MRRLLASVVVVAGSVVVPMAGPADAGGGCHQPEATSGTGDRVELRGGCFSPSILRVEPGTTVTFVNADPYQHALSGVNLGGYDDLAPGASVQHRFEEPGTYPYMCHLHPGMSGVAVVGDGKGGGRTVALGSAALASAAPDGGSDDGGVAPAAVVALALVAAGAGFGLARLTRKGPLPEA